MRLSDTLYKLDPTVLKRYALASPNLMPLVSHIHFILSCLPFITHAIVTVVSLQLVLLKMGTNSSVDSVKL
jgi:hypothetical protein